MSYEKALSDAYERGYNAGLKDNGVNAVLGEVTASDRALIIVALNHMRNTAYSLREVGTEEDKTSPLIRKLTKD